MKIFLTFASICCVLYAGILAQEVEETPTGDKGTNPRQSKALTVGLPFIFGMDLNRNRDAQKGNSTRMDLGVMGGLVRVSMDRTRDANGSRGPIDVRIFGIPFFGRR